MYYICKFSDSWSILDVSTNKSLPLEKPDIECLNRLLPTLLKEPKMLIALQVSSIQPNKLVKLSGPEKNGIPKKQTELPSK